jgi:tRNA(Arg) A34 adenosine deaminase TadA
MANKRKHIVIAKAYNSRGKCIVVAENSYTKTHPTQAKYAKMAGNEHAIFLHAEIAALIKAKEQIYKIEIFRFKADGSLALAKPCDVCSLAMSSLGVKSVYYSCNNGEFKKL